VESNERFCAVLKWPEKLNSARVPVPHSWRRQLYKLYKLLYVHNKTKSWSLGLLLCTEQCYSGVSKPVMERRRQSDLCDAGVCTEAHHVSEVTGSISHEDRLTLCGTAR